MEADVELIQSTFQALGLLINMQKSTLFLVQGIEFIGVVLYLTQARAFPITAARNCVKLLGHMASCTNVVQRMRLWFRAFQTWLASLGQHHLDRAVSLPLSMISTLLWWLDPRTVCAVVTVSRP